MYKFRSTEHIQNIFRVHRDHKVDVTAVYSEEISDIEPERAIVADGVTYLQHVINVVTLITSLPVNEALDLVA
ncbi:hypothetical protein ACUSIJ_18025 [Pseudochelatococcus sp. B33]